MLQRHTVANVYEYTRQRVFCLSFNVPAQVFETVMNCIRILFADCLFFSSIYLNLRVALYAGEPIVALEKIASPLDRS